MGSSTELESSGAMRFDGWVPTAKVGFGSVPTAEGGVADTANVGAEVEVEVVNEVVVVVAS